jgi:hypothetical protein
MARILKETKDWEGKTIKTVKDSYDEMLILFEDGDHAKIHIETGYYDSFSLATDSEFSDWERLDFGLMTQEQFDANLKMASERAKQTSLDWKREQLKRLRAELGE